MQLQGEPQVERAAVFVWDKQLSLELYLPFSIDDQKRALHANTDRIIHSITFTMMQTSSMNGFFFSFFYFWFLLGSG
jgi:hypothetical protein